MACYCVCLWGFGLSLKRSGVSVSVSTSLIVAKLLVRGVGIFCLPPYGALITYNMNSVRYFQLIYFLTLSLTPLWLIPYSIGRFIAAGIASSGSMPFTLIMDEDSSILTSEMSG